LFSLCTVPSYAEVTRIEVTRRADVLSGRELGLAGAYEKLSGKAYFTVDPMSAANQIITDIDEAPRNAEGKVEWSADFYVIKPKDARRGNGTVFLEIGNRGGRRLLNYFNLGDDAVGPDGEADLGDGFLMSEGFTLLWLGWQWDVATGEDLMRAYVPIATDNGRPIRGLVRADFVVSTRVQDHRLADRAAMPAYPVADPEAQENVLTVRDGVEASRRVIPRSQWRFARAEDGKLVDNPMWVYLDEGFEPFKIYEVVYVSEEPRLVGLGPAGVRDIVSYLKHGSPEPLGIPPGAIEHSLAFGISQSGRFLRKFLYDGFNQDEGGRRVFDGVLAHVAGGGRGSFNHRFAQPSRDAHPFINFFHPTDIFPFTDVSQTDPETGLSEGLLDHIEPRFLPKVFYTNSSYEYWGRAGSLVHTTIDGKADAPMMDSVRVYHVAGTQHGGGSFPPQSSPGQQLSNPADYRRVVRALLVALHRWVTEESMPPPSRYGHIADGTLVTPDRLSFPDLPGVRQNFSGIHKAYRVDYGPRFRTEGIVTQEPPLVGPSFPALVPAVDEDGNEVTGIRMPEQAVPLGTYTGWNLFNAASGPTDMLATFTGSFIPFPRTRAERESTRDPRLSIEERYASREEYLGKVALAATELIDQGYLLDVDLPAIVKEAGEHWDYIMDPPAPR
jgi:hypothetical protein